MCPRQPWPPKLHSDEITQNGGALTSVYVRMSEGLGIQGLRRQGLVFTDLILCPEAKIMSLGLRL